MVTLHPEESEVLKFFESLRLTVQVPPLGFSKTPDFLVDGDGRGYVVEVKARRDSEEWRRALRRGKVAYQERSMGYGPWTEDVARDAVNQLRSIDSQHRRWWILWLAVRCKAGPEAMFDEAVGSLFGVRQVAHYDAGDQRDTTRDCLFARRGVFERHCELVASVVATSSGFGFCVNELATDYRSFQSSAMYLRFASIHPPTSATDLTNNRGFFQISDFSVDRRDGHAVASYLEHAYGLPNAFMLDMKLHSASMLVPRRGATVTANNREQAPNEGTLPAAQKPGGR